MTRGTEPQPTAWKESALTKRRWGKYVLAAVVLLIVGIVTWCSIRPRPHLHLQMIERLQFGMTLAEVESIVRSPPGNYGIGPGKVNQVRVKTLNGFSGIGYSPAQGIERILSEFRYKEVNSENCDGPSATWTTRNRALFVRADSQGRVMFVAIGQRDEPEQNWIDRCLSRIDSWFEEGPTN